MFFRQPRLLGFGDAVGKVGDRCPIGAFFDRRIHLQSELFDHQFDRHARQGDARCGPGLEACDRLIDNLRHVAMAAEIVLVILDRLIGHQRAGGRQPRVEDMQAAEVVDRQGQHCRQDLGRGLCQHALLRIFEHVIGDAVGLTQRIAVDRGEFGQIGLGSGALLGVALR